MHVFALLGWIKSTKNIIFLAWNTNLKLVTKDNLCNFLTVLRKFCFVLFKNSRGQRWVELTAVLVRNNSESENLPMVKWQHCYVRHIQRWRNRRCVGNSSTLKLYSSLVRSMLSLDQKTLSVVL